MNRSEEYVAKLCRKSFLSLWNYPTPQGKNASKELCDILVVCDPDIVVFSVKEVGVGATGDPEINWNRWHKRAIDESAKQLYGAARFLNQSSGVVTADGQPGLSFPDASRQRIHLVAVALGGQREGPFLQGDFGKGFVHVFDERSLEIVLGELDTVTDFTQYLTDKEAFCGRLTGSVGADEDILAIYLSKNRTFPTDCDFFVADDTCWVGFSREPQYLARRAADQQSYNWDYLIELLSQEYKEGYLQPGLTLSEVEQVVRTMARENRFNRRVLAKHLADFLLQARQQRTRARITNSISGTTYVFPRCNRDESPERRLAELDMRTFVVRGSKGGGHTVVGITVVESSTERGFSLEVMHRHQPIWTEDDAALAAEVQRRTGYFSSPILTHTHEDEYPNT